VPDVGCPFFRLAADRGRSARVHRGRPSNPNGPSYVGTGEADMRSQISFGKRNLQIDRRRGKTWTHIGPRRYVGRIGKVIVPSERIRTSCSWRRSATCTARTPTAARVPLAKTAARPWQKSPVQRANDVGAIESHVRSGRPGRRFYASLGGIPAVRRGSIYPARRTGRAAGSIKSADGGPSETGKQGVNARPAGTDGVGPHIGVARRTREYRARVYAIVDAKEGGHLPIRRCGRNVEQGVGDSTTGIWGPRPGTSARSSSIRKESGFSSYVSNTGVYRFARWRGRTFGEPFKGSPGGDGLPSALD